MEHIKIYIEYIAITVESIGVLTMLLGIAIALGRYIFNIKKADKSSYIVLRQDIGKSILLGLEILIAADIIATVVTEPTLKSVAILGLIVLIRIILSLSLQVELEGRFPWQAEEKKELK